MDVVHEFNWNLRTTASVNSNLPDTCSTTHNSRLAWSMSGRRNMTYACYFYSYLQLGDFASLTAAFSLPPGYKRAITTNLAVSLKPYFTSAQIDPLISRRRRIRRGP